MYLSWWSKTGYGCSENYNIYYTAENIPHYRGGVAIITEIIKKWFVNLKREKLKNIDEPITPIGKF